MARVPLKQLYLALITMLARHGLAKPVAALAWAATRRIGGRGAGERYRLLLLEKDGFIQDVEAAFAARTDVALWGLPRDVPKAIARAFLPSDIDDNDYRVGDPAVAPAKAALRRFHQRLWPYYNAGNHFHAVLTGNFGYHAEREMAGALERLGTPFIALHKENLKTPGLMPFFEMIYRERRGPFEGRRIVVYNAYERDLELRSGAARAEQITIAGMARLDPIHRWRTQAAGTRPEPGVLFFSFGPGAGMPVLPRKGRVRGEVVLEQVSGFKEIRAEEFCRAVHRAVLDCARSNPNLPFVVKTKGRTRDLQELVTRFGIASESELPPNLNIIHSGDVLALITRASVVTGYNSTALLEALAAGRPIVQPLFEEAANVELAPFAVELGEAVEYATSPEQFATLLAQVAARTDPTPEQLREPAIRALSEWVGNPDGRAGIRAADAVLGEIS